MLTESDQYSFALIVQTFLIEISQPKRNSNIAICQLRQEDNVITTWSDVTQDKHLIISMTNFAYASYSTNDDKINLTGTVVVKLILIAVMQRLKKLCVLYNFSSLDE